MDVSVLDKEAAAVDANDLLAELRAKIEDGEAVTGGLERSLLSILSNAERSVGEALDRIRAGNARRANRHLETATRQLGGFLNRLSAAHESGQGGESGTGRTSEEGRNRLPASLGRTLDKLAESAIDRSTLAKRAAI